MILPRYLRPITAHVVETFLVKCAALTTLAFRDPQGVTLPRYLRPITARVVEAFLVNNVYQQLQFCFTYSSCNEGFFVLHYVLCDFVCVTAKFFCPVIVFYG